MVRQKELNLENMSDDVDRYFIVNDFDRPCPRLIAYMCDDGNLRYVNRDVRQRCGSQGISSDNICLSMFGFRLNNGHFTQVEESSATYPDGHPRPWQGLTQFSIESIL
jgi:hypothetical protein